eukprot:360339-Chlamydomonas_euryale.AAC.13
MSAIFKQHIACSLCHCLTDSLSHRLPASQTPCSYPSAPDIKRTSHAGSAAGKAGALRCTARSACGRAESCTAHQACRWAAARLVQARSGTCARPWLWWEPAATPEWPRCGQVVRQVGFWGHATSIRARTAHICANCTTVVGRKGKKGCGRIALKQQLCVYLPESARLGSPGDC